MATGFRARSQARRFVMQALYQWQLAGTETQALSDQYLAEPEMPTAAREYFETLLRTVLAHRPALEAALAPFLDRPQDQLDPVERAILLLAAAELAHRPDVPVRVVLNEAITLAHGYGAQDSHAFINGVLHRLAGKWRQREMARGAAPQ